MSQQPFIYDRAIHNHVYGSYTSAGVRTTEAHHLVKPTAYTLCTLNGQAAFFTKQSTRASFLSYGETRGFEHTTSAAVPSLCVVNSSY
jgi:hypothetical protein